MTEPVLRCCSSQSSSCLSLACSATPAPICAYTLTPLFFTKSNQRTQLFALQWNRKKKVIFYRRLMLPTKIKRSGGREKDRQINDTSYKSCLVLLAVVFSCCLLSLWMSSEGTENHRKAINAYCILKGCADNEQTITTTDSAPGKHCKAREK